MGSIMIWTCGNPKCRTTVGPVSGGPDRGFSYTTETRICTVCKQVHDYTTSREPRGDRDKVLREYLGLDSRGLPLPASQQPADPSSPPPGQEEPKGFTDPDPVCRDCGAETVAWDRKCPNCGRYMNASGPRILRD